MDKTILKELQDIKKALEKVVTRDDAQNFATKNDLKSFATKDDLKNLTTKDDLQKIEKKLVKEIRDTEAFIVSLVDKNMAEKSEIEHLQRRVAIIERKLAQ